MADLTNYRFPNNTAVIAITTHGAIQTVNDEKGVPIDIVTFKVPEGMTITKLSVSPIGICNMATPDDSTAMARAASAVFNDPNTNYTLQQRIDIIVPQLKKLQKGIVANVSKNQTPGVKKDELDYEFLVYADRSQVLKTYKSGEEMINKMYVKQAGEGKDDPFDFKMPILNQPNNPDFLQLIVTGKTGAELRSYEMDKEQFMTLSYIAGVLRQQCKVEHLVLLDYSCSSFYNDALRDRAKRALARDAMKEGLNGGKRTRRRNKKTKTRKAKKRTLSKWRR